MGINATARSDFLADLAAFKAANPGATRAQVRRYVASLHDASGEWLSKRDAQDSAAFADFAASRQALFKAFTDALPEPSIDPVDPQS
jgi:hypothetical protein